MVFLFDEPGTKISEAARDIWVRLTDAISRRFRDEIKDGILETYTDSDGVRFVRIEDLAVLIPEEG